MKRKTDESSNKLLASLRQTVLQFIEDEDFQSAAFWCDKVLFLSKHPDEDVFVQSKCFYHLGEYHRASYCITSRNLHKTNLKCRHLAAKCHVGDHNHTHTN